MNASQHRPLGVLSIGKLLAACVAVVLSSSSAVAQWTVINLHPAGANESKGYGIRNGVQVGYVDSNAAKWTGNVGSYVNFGGRAAFGTDGVQQVGFHAGGAALWNGTPLPLIDLTPPPPAPPDFYAGSEATGVFAGMQVGTNVVFKPSPGAFFGEAGMWFDSGASWTSLHPANALSSVGEGTHNAAQVGYADVPVGSGAQRHAALWFSSPVMTDLNPAGAVASHAFDIYNGVQVGSATFNPGSGPEAALWTGSAASFTNLHPLAATSSELFGLYNGKQAGYVKISSPRGQFDHASFWSNSAATWEDLHTFLPSGYSESRAEGVWTSVAGDQYVVGWAINATTGLPEAKLWTTFHETVPEPSAIVLMVLGTVAIVARRTR